MDTSYDIHHDIRRIGLTLEELTFNSASFSSSRIHDVIKRIDYIKITEKVFTRCLVQYTLE